MRGNGIREACSERGKGKPNKRQETLTYHTGQNGITKDIIQDRDNQ